MTKTEREGLRALLAKAIQGRWFVAESGKSANGTPVFEVVIDDGRPPSVASAEFYGDPDDANLAIAAVNALPSLLDAIEAGERDAARYRWLRSHYRPGPYDQHRLEWYLPWRNRNDSDGLDAAIDAAIQQEADHG